MYKLLFFFFSLIIHTKELPKSTDLFYYLAETKQNQFQSLQVFLHQDIPTKIILLKNKITIEMNLILENKNIENCLLGKKDICKTIQKEKFLLKFISKRNNHFIANVNIPILGKILEIYFFENKKLTKKEKFIIHSFAYVKKLSLSSGEIVEFPQVGFIDSDFNERVNLDFSNKAFELYKFRKQYYLHQEKKSKFFPDEYLTYYDESTNESSCNLIFLNSKFFSSICRNHSIGSSSFTDFTKYVFYKNAKTGFKKINLTDLFTESGEKKIFYKIKKELISKTEKDFEEFKDEDLKEILKKIEFTLDSEKLIIYFSEGILLSNYQGDFTFEFLLVNFIEEDKTEILVDILND